jgi:translation initiation factor IF-2
MANKTERREAPAQPAAATAVAVAKARMAQKAAPPTAPKTLDIPQAIGVGELAKVMKVTPIEVIKQLMRHGHMFSVNEVINHDVAAEVAKDFGFAVAQAAEKTQDARLVVSTEGEDPAQLQPRSPVVTILGHVDHGKTTLLDAIRNTRVAAGEAGGITQHIGAYQVEYKGHPITFLDTPGHAAFTAMRARGAKVTDIAVLVVAADDGIMPQTIEAIDHAKAAGVPIVVAINKMDKPGANPDRVKQQLSEHGLVIEEWGGDVIAVPVSALKGQGIPDLLENILVVAEVAELKANPNRSAKGIVVEARIDKSRGPVATVLVQAGTLHIGDYLVAGPHKGRVKAMLNDRGKRIKDAGPSTPVEILGMESLPEAGEKFEVVADERTARQTTEAKAQEQQARTGAGVTLEDVYTRIESGEVKAINLILKTDVQGSVEAIRKALERLNTERTRVNVIHAAAGSITESDVLLAVASKAIIVGFNSQPEPGARTLGNQVGVDIRHYNIIYSLVDDVERALQGLLEPVYRDIIEGQATVRAVFSLGRGTTVAGFYVNSGKVVRDAEIRVFRGGKQVFAGKIVSLKHFKDDVREVNTGLEGGLTLEGFKDYQTGDILEAHRRQQVGVG